MGLEPVAVNIQPKQLTTKYQKAEIGFVKPEIDCSHVTVLVRCTSILCQLKTIKLGYYR